MTAVGLQWVTHVDTLRLDALARRKSGLLRGPLYRDGYRPQLSGHETFPLRYGWLKKACDAVDEVGTRDVFTNDDAIARFGVGKNMVASIRHWATAAGVIEESADGQAIGLTRIAERLFSAYGLDPYMENLATAWLIHWVLSTCEAKTTWFWAFHYYPAQTFERDDLVDSIVRLAGDRGWPRASVATIRRDVSCFLRTYVPLSGAGSQHYEDGLESPLTELGLIRATGRRDGFRFNRGPKPTLGLGVFTYAVRDFWEGHLGQGNTLSFESLAYEPGSPGRAFLLDEDSLMDMLARLDGFTEGSYQWSETAGLGQLLMRRRMGDDGIHELLEQDFTGSGRLANAAI